MDVAANLDISTPEHWARLRATGLCNELCDVSEFWTSFETSSIPAERVFAIMRLMELPTRGSQLPATWARELRFRVMRKTQADSSWPPSMSWICAREMRAGPARMLV